MKTLTIRNVPPTLAEALEREKRRRGESLNQTVIELLGQGLGVGEVRSNGLAALAGNWNEEEFRQFEEAVTPFEEIDPELWR
jgi:plasmid stability protein